MDGANYNTFLDNKAETQSDCSIRLMILRHTLYWLGMPITMIITIFFVMLDYHISEILLASSGAQTIVTIIQLLLIRHNYVSQEEIDVLDAYGSICVSSFVWFVVNVIASSLKIKMIDWYVLLMVYMPSAIWFSVIIGVGLYNLYHYIKTKMDMEAQSNRKPTIGNTQINTEPNEFDDLDNITIGDVESDVSDKN
jgi:hypothetical protein